MAWHLAERLLAFFKKPFRDSLVCAATFYLGLVELALAMVCIGKMLFDVLVACDFTSANMDMQTKAPTFCLKNGTFSNGNGVYDSPLSYQSWPFIVVGFVFVRFGLRLLLHVKDNLLNGIVQKVNGGSETWYVCWLNFCEGMRTRYYRLTVPLPTH